MATRQDGRSNRFIPPDSDSANPTTLARNLRNLYTQLYSALDRITELESQLHSASTFSSSDLTTIRNELQSSGHFPLNVSSLAGRLGEPQYTLLVLGSGTMPNVQPYTLDQLGALINPATYDQLVRVTENPKAWTALNLLPDNVALLDSPNIFTMLQTFAALAGLSVADTTHGASFDLIYREEEVTLSTVGTTTDSSANLIPGNGIVIAVPQRITQTISGGGVTALQTGDAATPSTTRFSATNTLTAGPGPIGMDQWKGGVATDAAGPYLAAAGKVRFTTVGGTPTQGKVRVGVLSFMTTPQTS